MKQKDINMQMHWVLGLLIKRRIVIGMGILPKISIKEGSSLLLFILA
jgi:hypothetical protein